MLFFAYGVKVTAAWLCDPVSDMLFKLKTETRLRGYTQGVIISVSAYLLFGTVIHYAAHVATTKDTAFSFTKGFWFIFVSSFTIGFGDMAPQWREAYSAVVAMGYIFFGILLIALIAETFVECIESITEDQAFEKVHDGNESVQSTLGHHKKGVTLIPKTANVGTTRLRMHEMDPYQEAKQQPVLLEEPESTSNILMDTRIVQTAPFHESSASISRQETLNETNLRMEHSDHGLMTKQSEDERRLFQPRNNPDQQPSDWVRQEQPIQYPQQPQYYYQQEERKSQEGEVPSVPEELEAQTAHTHAELQTTHTLADL
jgi:hypothetical protein